MIYQVEKDHLFITDPQGNILAEVTFPITDGVANINHTFVHESMRGDGLAGRMMRQTAEQIRLNGLKARPTCSFAILWFKQNPEFHDLLVD